jgi:RNA polymerase sigma-70 factor (ECF subfamily)
LSREASRTDAGPAFHDTSDGALLEASARRDTAAFAEIVRRYHQPVYRVVWRMMGGHADSEDVAQEAFLKLWQNPLQVRQAGALKGWLMRVASNAVIDRSRKPKHGDLDSAPDLVDDGVRPDAPLDRGQAARLVDQAISRLPDRQRQALSLVYFEGMSNIETASAMELSIEAVESLLARARRGLKQSLSAEWRDLLDGLTE